MDVLKPSSEKKKKKVTKRRALEIKRRKSSILHNAANLNDDQLDSIARGDLEEAAESLLCVNEEEEEDPGPNYGGRSRRGSFMESTNLLLVHEAKEEFRSRSRRGSCVESLSLLSVNENSSSVKKNDNEVEKSSQETENINENENENNCDQTEFVENNLDIVEEVDNDADTHEWQESDLWKQTKPITLIKDISKKVKARRASLMPTEQRRRSSELSDSETKAALDLLRLQKTVDAMKGERRPSTNAKFFWDDVNSNPAISSESDGGTFRSKVRETMTKDTAMSVLGLSMTSEGKQKKALTIADYNEQQLLTAFRETCTVIEEGSVTKVSKIEAHEAYQILLKILRAKNKFLAKRSKKPEQEAE